MVYLLLSCRGQGAIENELSETLNPAAFGEVGAACDVADTGLK